MRRVAAKPSTSACSAASISASATIQRRSAQAEARGERSAAVKNGPLSANAQKALAARISHSLDVPRGGGEVDSMEAAARTPPVGRPRLKPA